jgi:hypothetical protein
MERWLLAAPYYQLLLSRQYYCQLVAVYAERCPIVPIARFSSQFELITGVPRVL